MTLWVLVVLAGGCGPAGSTRYFRLIFEPAAPAIPDSCFRSDSVPPPVTPDEQAAQSFCNVPFGPPQGSPQPQITTTFRSSTTISIFEDGESHYLVFGQTSFGGGQILEGTRSGDTYTFRGTEQRTIPFFDNRVFGDARTQTVELTVTGGDVRGSSTTGIEFSCLAGGCPADFALRCPSCQTTSEFTGLEVFDVTQILLP